MYPAGLLGRPQCDAYQRKTALSRKIAPGGLIKKRLQPLLDLINEPINSRIHPLPDHSVYKNYDCYESDKCQDLH